MEPEERVIQAMEKAAGLYGMNESFARIYGTLYFGGEMTLDDLAEETGYAKSTVSRAMKKLENFYMASSRKKPGHGKTKYYTAEEDLEETFRKFLENEVSQEIEIMLDALEKAGEELDEQDDKETLEKVRNLEKTYSRSRKILTVVTSIPRGKFIKKIQDIFSTE